MKILCIHADYIEFEAKKKAFKQAEEGVEKGQKEKVEECLVIFTAVEKRDEANVDAVITRYLDEIRKIAQQLTVPNIVLYPYAHLSSDLSKPYIAENLMKKAEQILKEENFTVHRAPFGWYKSFSISCKGHPLSELSREFGPENVDTNKPVVTEESVSENDTYKKLISFLDENNAKYRLIDHEPEGRTELVSPMRGNKLSQAAHCIIIKVKIGKKESKYVLAVVPGDARVDMDAVKTLFNGSYASFADKEIAEKLSKSVSGTILPFSFNNELELVVDPKLLEGNDELFFNAARLDRSMALRASDYEKLAGARFESIAKYEEKTPEKSLKREYKDEPFTFDDKELSKEEKINLSTAFVVGKAIQDVYPKAEVGSIGFYHNQTFVDVAGISLNNENVKKIEKQVQRIISANLVISSGDKDNLNTWQSNILKDLGQEKAIFKIEETSIVPQFNDPFVSSTKEIGAFKVLNLASAYWKGNEKNQQLMRINCVGFSSEKGLGGFLKAKEEAEGRSHMKIGREQELFVISDLVGAGMPLLAPKGMILRTEIVNFLWDIHKNKGYQRVWTPHIAKKELYQTSGHWDKFGDELFHVKGKYEQFVMKPMNCPHHMQIFDSFSLSYRDMPIRFFEPATIYRDEKTGQLHGLSRVRAITQDDGHLFCRVSQIKEEVGIVVGCIREFFSVFGMDDYWVSLSVRGDDKSKYLGEDDAWEIAEKALEDAAKENNLQYKRIEGEAAFYGPKLDFMFKDALRREWQLSTIQVDFNMPERFDLGFMNEKSLKERPVVIHRAISGSLERFMSVLIEHFAGKFPLWLNPVQVKLVTITDRSVEFAKEVFEKLKSAGVRVELDIRSETMGRKIRDSQKQKVNYILTIGDTEVENKCVAVRTREGEESFDVNVDEFVKKLLNEITEKKL
jgi:threonyl-tRNA synthetase